jgi:hypothetical protein
MIDDILNLVEEILVIVDAETSVTPESDWSALPNNQKEQLVESLLNQSFKNSITGTGAGQTTPAELFGTLITHYELNESYSEWQEKNEWFKGRIPKYEAKYKIKWDETYTGDISQGGPLAIYGYLKKNWMIFAGIIIVAVLTIIYLPKFLKKIK